MGLFVSKRYYLYVSTHKEGYERLYDIQREGSTYEAWTFKGARKEFNRLRDKCRRHNKDKECGVPSFYAHLTIFTHDRWNDTHEVTQWTGYFI